MTIIYVRLALFALGGIIYAVKKPDPKPELIGFHGIFHVMVLSGAALHSIALYYSVKWYPLILEQMKLYQ